MKKLAVFVMIPALVLLTAALGAAQNANWGAVHSIKGVYAVTGVTVCNPSAPTVLEGDYTFNGNGTGSVQNGVIRSVSPNSAPPPAALGSHVHFTATFEYDVTQDGRITFHYPDGGNTILLSDDGTKWITWNEGPSHGVISPDGKTITITCGPPVSLFVLRSSGGAGVPPAGMPANCITSATGVRLH